MLKILVINRQKTYRVPSKPLASLGRYVLLAEGVQNGSCAVVLLDDETLADFHKSYLGTKKKTDVISFPFREKERDGTFYLGDVLVSVDCAHKKAPEFRHSFVSELNLYVIHGILHLLGYDDIALGKRKIMKKRESELWTAWERRQKSPGTRAPVTRTQN